MSGGGDVRRMKYESCQEIVAGKDYTRDEPLCDNTPSHRSQPAASSRYREEAREEKGGNPEFLLNIQTLRISHSSVKKVDVETDHAMVLQKCRHRERLRLAHTDV